MVVRYAHLAPEQLRSAVSCLDDVLVPARSSKNRAEQTETLITEIVAAEDAFAIGGFSGAGGGS